MASSLKATDVNKVDNILYLFCSNDSRLFCLHNQTHMLYKKIKNTLIKINCWPTEYNWHHFVDTMWRRSAHNHSHPSFIVEQWMLCLRNTVGRQQCPQLATQHDSWHHWSRTATDETSRLKSRQYSINWTTQTFPSDTNKHSQSSKNYSSQPVINISDNT